jgi:hypothetical protein
MSRSASRSHTVGRLNGTPVIERNAATQILTAAERRLLIWLAGRFRRTSAPITSPVSFVSMVLVGASFAVRAMAQPLLGVIVFRTQLVRRQPRRARRASAVTSGPGKLPMSTISSTRWRRVRSQRPRHGGHDPLVAAGFLIAYYILSIEIFLATYCVGRFQMSFWGWGPTELRILLSIGTLMLFWKPVVTIFGAPMPLFDAGGIVGAAGLIVTAIVSAIGNTRTLYTAEPLPQTSPSQPRDAETRRSEETGHKLLLLCGLRK